MAEKDTQLKEKLEKIGIWNYKDAYAYAYDWFREEDFGVIEDKYQEKVSGNERDIGIKWKAKKKITDYFHSVVEVEWEITDMSSVEVEIDGKKSKSNKGRIVLRIKGILVKDPNSSWDGSPLYKFWREVYDKYVIPHRTDEMEDKVWDHVQDFKEHMKAFFEMSGKQ